VIKYYSISELSKILNSENINKSKISNSTLRYWEKEFKQIKPKLINNRRYYSFKQVEQIKLIRHLLKDKGMKINGVKKLLNFSNYELDDKENFSLKDNLYKEILKNKTKKLLEKIKKIKHGKKNTY
tara:strand:+ start:562 stop:939 length:378 start_codon:yes stop_codon:yes gene_type:complete